MLICKNLLTTKTRKIESTKYKSDFVSRAFVIISSPGCCRPTGSFSMVSILHLHNYKFVRPYINRRQWFWQGQSLNFRINYNQLNLNIYSSIYSICSLKISIAQCQLNSSEYSFIFPASPLMAKNRHFIVKSTIIDRLYLPKKS